MAQDLGMVNKLYFGDNLKIMRDFIGDETVDLIYLDPPFNSKATYNMLFQEKNGSASAAQITAFEDTWHWGYEAEDAFRETVTQGSGKLPALMNALRGFLGSNDMLAYLTMMAIRLVEMRRVLKETGSIYLHCDPTASHYLKLVMDAVFGPQNFLNELIWYYRGAGTPKKEYARRHDVLLYYANNKSKHYFDPDPIRQPYAEATKDRFSHYIGNVRGEKDYGTQELNPLGKHPDDVVTHIQPIAPSAKARLGYPTQKPEELLEHIIRASTRQGGLVLDPFCGCGTTIAVAERLARRWIGIDITHLAIALMKSRLEDSFGDDLSLYEIIGEPPDLGGARALAHENRHQFEWWALSLVDARPVKDERKKGADRGIDGKMFFFDDESGKAKTLIIQVKSGHVGVSQIRDLKGVLEREKAAIGAFITLEEPTGPMKKEAVSAGFYEPEHFSGKYPRLQILTIEELLDGKTLEYPRKAPEPTFKRAERKRKAEAPEELF